MTTLVVVQARSGSTRLPGKVHLPLAGEPLLVRLLERVTAATTPFDVVVATTTDPADDGIVDLARRAGVRAFRGHPTDLLDRHYRAALAAGPAVDTVVKIPSDCPLIDPAVIDRVLAAHASASHAGGQTPSRADFTSNLHPATYPDGNDVEVMTLEALAVAHREAQRPLEREHTTPFLWERPERFRVVNVAWETGLDLSMSHRFTVDYPADYEFVAAVYSALWTSARPVFSLGDILRLIEARADIFAINQRYAGVNWYRHHLAELHTVGAADTRTLEGSP
jgi:spore coat polysaccharide biosynthesis protein SpsF